MDPPEFEIPAPDNGVIIETPKGRYLQSTVTDEDPSMMFNPDIVDPSAYELYTPEEITAAQKTVATFIAEEGIDSGLNGGAETADAWWERNHSKLAPEYKEELREGLIDGSAPMVNVEKWHAEAYGAAAETEEGKKLSYEYVYSPTEPRVGDRTITPTNVYAVGDGTGALVVQTDVSYSMKVVPGPRLEGRLGSGIQTSEGPMGYSIDRDPNTGEWLITGFQHQVVTTEG